MKLTLLLILCLITLTYARKRDHYKVLNLTRHASSRDIKRAFRSCSRLYHPDKNPNNEKAHDKFIECNTAYEILSDDETRKIYDRHGHKGVEQHQKNKAAGGGGGGFNPFNMFFNNGQREENDEDARTPDIEAEIWVGLKDIYEGKIYETNTFRQVQCPHCFGTGAESDDHIHKCRKCGGDGIILEKRQIGPGFIQQIQKECPRCGGQGTIIKKYCHVCQGKGVSEGTHSMFIEIQRGTPDGHKILLDNEGDEHKTKKGGHITFIVKTFGEQGKWKRDGENINNLHYYTKISLLQSLIGYDFNIKHLDGHEVNIKSEKNKVTKPNSEMIIENEGMPILGSYPTKFGNLIVHFEVIFPKKLTKKQIQGIAKLRLSD